MASPAIVTLWFAVRPVDVNLAVSTIVGILALAGPHTFCGDERLVVNDGDGGACGCPDGIGGVGDDGDDERCVTAGGVVVDKREGHDYLRDARREFDARGKPAGER